MSGTPGLATAADYSEAMSVVRRAKSVLVLLILLMLVLQIAVFFMARYEAFPISTWGLSASDSTTQPVTTGSDRLTDVMHYVTGVTLLGGIGLGIVLAMVLMIILHIMLVGRLIGVSKVASSLVWCLILVVFLFPWQTFMNNAGLTQTDFRVPGVLWTWGELVQRYRFPNDFSAEGWATTILSWFRFVGAPLVAVVLTLMIQLKSNRGIKMAMGEDEVLNEVMNQASS